MRAVAPNCELRVVYGSTEAEPISTLSGCEIEAEDQRRVIEGGGLLVGGVVPGCELQIIADKWGEPLGDLRPDQFDRLQMPVGRVGEIVVSGKHVLQSYLNIADNRTAKFTVGKSLWHRTGDSGYVDDAGRLWLTGRCSAALRDGAGVVYPFELELPLAAVAGVRKAALLDNAGVRVLVLELEPERKSIADLALHPLVRRARIDHIAIVSRMPMDKRHNSKVDYMALEHLLDGKWLRYRALFAKFLTEVGKAAAKLTAQLRLVMSRSS
jgi:acyl-CoA synthetase (AMP-forming)/AMP-acid ligase II